MKGYKIEVALTKDELPNFCDVQDENMVYWIANAVKYCGKSSKFCISTRVSGQSVNCTATVYNYRIYVKNPV